jgi:acyl carrier protein
VGFRVAYPPPGQARQSLAKGIAHKIHRKAGLLRLDKLPALGQACRVGRTGRPGGACHGTEGHQMSNVQQETIEIIAKQAKIELDTIKPESTLKDLGVASLDAIEVIFDIEEHFGINLPNEDTDFDNGTVGQLVEAVERQLAAKKND